MSSFFPIGQLRMSTQDPQREAYVLWCTREDGYDAIGVAYVDKNQAHAGILSSLQHSQFSGEQLFLSQGIKNSGEFQCSGPFVVTLGDQPTPMFVVSGPGKVGMRAFLVVRAEDAESALRPIKTLLTATQSGVGILTSDTLQLIAEFDNVVGDTLSPQADFIFQPVMG